MDYCCNLGVSYHNHTPNTHDLHSITDLGVKRFLVRSGLSTSPNWSIKLTARRCRLGVHVHVRELSVPPSDLYKLGEASAYRLKSSWYDYPTNSEIYMYSTVPLTHSRGSPRGVWGPLGHAHWHTHTQSHRPSNLRITRKHFNFPNTWGFYTIPITLLLCGSFRPTLLFGLVPF